MRAIKRVPQVFERCRRETFSFVNNDQFDYIIASDQTYPLTAHSRLFDTGLDTSSQPMQVLPELTQGATDGRRVEHRAGAGQGGIHLVIRGVARSPGVQQGFGQIPMGMAAGGEGFANAGGTKAQPNRTMLAKCVRKFREPPVFLGHDERTGPMATRTGGHGLSSR